MMTPMSDESSFGGTDPLGKSGADGKLDTRADVVAFSSLQFGGTSSDRRVTHNLLDGQQREEERERVAQNLYERLLRFIDEQRKGFTGRGRGLSRTAATGFHFEIRGLPDDFEATDDFDLQEMETILIGMEHIDPVGPCISVIKHDTRHGQISATSVILSDGSIKMHREDITTTNHADGGFTIEGQVGFQMNEVPLHILPDEAVEREVAEQVAKMCEGIIKCARLTMITDKDGFTERGGRGSWLGL